MENVIKRSSFISPFTESRYRIRGISLSEIGWFSLCLCLFMILGPFAAPFAVVAVFKSGVMNASAPEPELLDESLFSR